MRALRVTDSGTRLVDVPEPVAGDEAIVRVTMSGLCNTDLEIARGYAGFRGTIGHEFVGVVVDAGGGPLTTGTRVVGEINAGCGTCDRCRGGDPRHCATRTVLGIVGRDGAHADYLRLPARNLLAVPAQLTDAQAVFVEPLAAAAGVLERCPYEPGMRVAVVGDGKLGLLCALALHARGIAPLLVGKHANKLAIAGDRGVETTTVDDARARGRVFDIVIEASGGPSGFSLGLDLLVPQGALVLKSTFASDGAAHAIDAARIVVEEIRVIGSRCGRFAPALSLLERNLVTVDPLIADVIDLADAERAMGRAAEPGVLKVLLAR